jgi:hypothetical protein
MNDSESVFALTANVTSCMPETQNAFLVCCQSAKIGGSVVNLGRLYMVKNANAQMNLKSTASLYT